MKYASIVTALVVKPLPLISSMVAFVSECTALRTYWITEGYSRRFDVTKSILVSRRNGCSTRQYQPQASISERNRTTGKHNIVAMSMGKVLSCLNVPLATRSPAKRR